MRYAASEKLEIIQIVEQSHLPVVRTLEKLGIPRQTFYRWYDRYLTGGPAALEDRRPQPGRVWNRIPDEVREKIVDLGLSGILCAGPVNIYWPMNRSPKITANWARASFHSRGARFQSAEA